MNIFSLVPDTVWLVDEDEIFILGVDHFAHVVHVHVLEQDQHLADVRRVSWASKRPLATVLHVHVVMIVTIPVGLELPAATILELLGDGPPVPVLSHPVDRRSAVSGINLEDVEAGSEAEGAHGERLPEASPFHDASVLVNRLSQLEVQRRVRVHRRRLHEWLELVARVGRCSFNANDFFDGLLAKDGVSETTGHMRELLVIAPFHLPLVASVMIVMMRSWSIGKSLLVVDFLCLGEPSAGGLPPSVVELKVNVVQVEVDAFLVGHLVVLSRNVALLLEVLGTDLSDVHVNEVGVVAVNLDHLVLIVAVDVDVVAGANMLVRQDDLRLSELVSRRLHVPHLHVALSLLLVHFEEEVLFGDDFLVGVLCELL